MELDLYQRRGMHGLGEDVPPFSAASAFSSVTGALSSGPTPTLSWSTIALLGIGAWVLVSAVGRGTQRAYGAVSKPLKKYTRKRKRLKKLRADYDEDRRGILG